MLQPEEFTRAPKEAKFMTSFFAKGKRVLDAAGGTGRLSIPLAKMGYNVTCVDITPAMINIAKQKKGSEKIKFVNGDMCTLKTKKKFSGIVCGSNTMAHLLTNKKAIACLKNFRKTLVKGGGLVFDMWNCESYDYNLVTKNTVKKKRCYN